MRCRKEMALAISMALLGLIGIGSPSQALAQPVGGVDAAQPATGTVGQLARWIVASEDNRGLPFAIIDKVAAKVFVFDAAGRRRGAAAALLGFAAGDDSTPGIGDRELSAIRPEERTTPAGRFMSGFGKDGVFWVDYATAVSLHPVITGTREEHRRQRLQSPSADDNRITFGCINVPGAFFEKVVRSTFKGRKAVVYILPETKPMGEVFPTFALQALANPAPTGALADALDPGRAEATRVSDPAPPAAPRKSPARRAASGRSGRIAAVQASGSLNAQ